MNNFDLNLMGVQEMNALEMKQTAGGAPWWWLVAFGIYLFDNRDQFINGVKDGLNDFC